MMIELHSKEVEMIDEALKAWEEAPARDGSMSMMITTIMSKMAPGGAMDVEKERESMKRKYEIETAQRRRQAVLLRAKLFQAQAKESEHVAT